MSQSTDLSFWCGRPSGPVFLSSVRSRDSSSSEGSQLLPVNCFFSPIPWLWRASCPDDSSGLLSRWPFRQLQCLVSSLGSFFIAYWQAPLLPTDGSGTDFRLFARSKIFSYFIRYLFFWSSRGKLFIFFDLKTFQYLPSQAPLWGIRRTECSLLQVNCGCQSVNGWSDHDFFLCRLDLNWTVAVAVMGWRVAREK